MAGAATLPWLLLPGLDGGGTLFANLVAARDDAATTIVRYPDHPDTDLDACVAEVERQRPRSGAFVAVAESFSGPVALRWARTAPDGLAALVLVASFHASPHPLLPLACALIGIAASPRMRTLATHDAVLRALCLGSGATPADLATLRAAILAMPTAVLRSRLRLLRDLDESTDSLPSDLPILCLRPTHDRLVFRHHMDGALYGAHHDVREIDGPHFLLQARAKACADAIEGWLNGLPYASTTFGGTRR
ncbi:hypothetical protein ACQQ2N_09420 [Dokdonella sp. MW10]|uniref:hypothetical protein n=1 Tax=Dokdonella sp. MW10 TaxID=2992926 RepID=UPI003F8181E0